MAFKEINRGFVDYAVLYSKVMAMASEVYSENMLAATFDHLCETRRQLGVFWQRMLSFGSFG